ncbi:MAG: transposase [Candidatus Paceibacterota bacterium]
MPIVKDESDHWRFLKILRHLNDEYISERWEEELEENVKRGAKIFDRPINWPKQKPLTSILSYTLMPNHFHILAKETINGGIAKFMQKLGNSMTGHFNLKYGEAGSIFQGSYKARTIQDDKYFRYLAVYIMVKNPMELYPGGLKNARDNFEDAFRWAINYPFCSLADYTGNREYSLILEKGLLGEVFSSPKDFKNFAKDFILGRADIEKDDNFAGLTCEIKTKPVKS